MDSQLLIDGQNCPANSGLTFDRLSPLDGQVVTRAAAARDDDVKLAISAAERAYASWSQSAPITRRAILNRAAQLMRERAEDLIATGVAETGATAPWIAFNVETAAQFFEEAAASVTFLKGETYPVNKPGSYAIGFREPVGVMVGMAPWNAPVILAARAVAMPIACGNTVVMKASEVCPRLHLMVGQVLVDAGLPNGVINVVTHSAADAPEVVQSLIEHPAVRHINFTGSTRVGKIVAELAARQLKPVLLELGGKSPLLVLGDADIDAAVNGATFGTFMNQGQICMSTERILVDDAVAESFVSRFAERAKSITVGPPDEGAIMGAVAFPETAARLASLIDDATSKGATVVAGGKSNSAIMPATVVDHVTPEMDLFHEESFGPIVAITRASGDDALVALANNSDFGLAASVFSKNVGRAMEVARRIEAGMCRINGPTVFDEPQLPFGGVKNSGFGRFGGQQGVEEFTQLRLITVEASDQHYPF